MPKIHIIIRTDFEAIHCWPECPFPEVGFLKNPHRHKFFVEVRIVTTQDRQLEFFMVKTNLDNYIKTKFKDRDLGRTSCETMAKRICFALNANYVSVFEDDQVGASYEV